MQIIHIRSDIVIVTDLWRELFLESPALLPPHPLPNAVGLVDVAELVDEVVEVLYPEQALHPHWDLGAAGSHNAPAESLLGSEVAEPVEVLTEHSDTLRDDGRDGGVWERLLPLEDFELWDHLLLENIQHETLEFISLWCDCVLRSCNNC